MKAKNVQLRILKYIRPVGLKKELYIILIRYNRYIETSTLTHGIFHATKSILRMSHINFYEDEETYAKLNGELNSFIMSKLTDSNERFVDNQRECTKVNKCNI